MDSRYLKTPSEIIEGIRPVQELLRTNIGVESIWIAKQLMRRPDIRELQAAAVQKGIPVRIVPDEVIREKTRSPAPQGVLAITAPIQVLEFNDWLEKHKQDKKSADFILLLDHIEDPQNFGAIIRSAEAAGVQAILFPTHRASPVNSTVVKASAGAAFHIPLVAVGSLRQAMLEIQEENIAMVGLDVEGTVSHFQYFWTGDVALVVGSEHKGLSKPIRDACSALVKIPLGGKVESLNASAAAAVVLFEVVRQRQQTI